LHNFGATSDSVPINLSSLVALEYFDSSLLNVLVNFNSNYE